MIIQQSKSPFNTEYVWNQNWIQKYEMYDNIIKKFKYANQISETNFVNEFVNGDKEQKLIDTLGFSKNEYQKDLNNMVFSRIGNSINNVDSIISNPRICTKCYLKGFHSVFHQILIFSNCIYHKKEKLIQYSDIWRNNLNLLNIYNGELKIQNIYNIWSKKVDITDIKYYKFISLPPIFFDSISMKQNVELEGFDTDDESIINQFLDERILNKNNGVTASVPLLEGEDLSRWWERQRRQKFFLNRKLLYGGLIKQNNNKKRYFIPEIQKNGFKYSYWDIRKSINHYIMKILVKHKYCINNDLNGCLIADFYKEFKSSQSIMQTNYRITRYNMTLRDSLKQEVLKGFIREKKYLYDPELNEFKDSINHLSEFILDTDNIGFHMYHDRVYLIMITILTELNIPHSFKNQGLQMGYSKNKAWFYYCPSISNILHFLLEYCDSNDKCSN